MHQMKRVLLVALLACLLTFIVGSFHEPRMLAAQSPPPAAPSAPPDQLRVVLLGSGVGPLVNLQQFGASTLVEAGGVRLLFDCGRGATIRLTQMGVNTGSISRVFLTHLHSDHVIQIPDLLLTGWLGAGGRGNGRLVPLSVWGPEGTRDMMDHLQRAFAFDIHMRRDLDEKIQGEGIKVISHDIKQGVVFDEQGVRVTAFLVDHGIVAPAFGYRVDYRGRSVVLSGDTRVSENLVAFSKGVDVLIHEVVDPDVIRARSPDAEAIIAHHTTPEEAGTIFSRVKPRLAVYSHAPATAAVLTKTRTTYAGPLQAAEDRLTIEIGETITVRRFEGPM
jgi:ribonuclease Z